jgi:SAM-dependent methyltransferase
MPDDVLNSRVRDAYADRASEYSALLGSIAATSELDQHLIREWSSNLHGRVIDAGCGPGHWTEFLHELGVDVEGIDPVAAFIEEAAVRFPGVPFRVASFNDLAAREMPAAGILAWYSLIHLDPAELPDVVAGLAGCLEPDGSLLIGFFTGERLEAFPHAITTAYYWPVAEMTNALASAGFQVEQTHTRTDPGSRPHAAMVARLRPIASR